jgi:hypothetical protein
MAFPFDAWPAKRRADNLAARLLAAVDEPGLYLTTEDAPRFGVTRAAMRRAFSHLKATGRLLSDNTVRPARYSNAEFGAPPKKERVSNTLPARILRSFENPWEYITVKDAARFGATPDFMRQTLWRLKKDGRLRADDSTLPFRYYRLEKGVAADEVKPDNGRLLQTVWAAASTVQEDL